MCPSYTEWVYHGEPVNLYRGTMSNFPAGFDKSDSLLDFNVEEFNNVGGTSSVGDIYLSTYYCTPRRQKHSRSLELDRYVAQNGKILISIALGQNNPISPHVVVTLEYIELVKGGLQQWFVLDFIDSALLGLLSIKCSFAERSSGGRTIAILRSSVILNRLVPTHPNIDTSYATTTLLDNFRAARAKQPYNQSSDAKSFLQRQHELAEQRGHLIDHVKLFKKTHARGGQFVSSTTADSHNQMLKLQSQPTPEGSQPLSGDEICETVLGRRLSY
ncbi:CACTA en-spm transposon protein [Cucumis melo var. makuwa]|uniref:CACTA en-spm transposon protein n=1 Tax=Cucumis melo var. makuwa TaxID=1194695 RepID=A0A5A7TTS1_CUCMM|nr:CACTA en-spm transposon protein [Cucumis melo var. makuwa]TYK04819.1 CACTA en-spm transposon protein [Cucumis melo var. makuwa]